MSTETETPDGCDHAMTAEHAKWLSGLPSLPRDIRVLALRRLANQHGVDALVGLFADFVGLANQVVSNNRGAIELYLITERGHHPSLAEQINLPDLAGALAGVVLADRVDQSRLCGGCAFRAGSVANQCAPTTSDADWCGHPGEATFMCHEDLDEKGAPVRACAGFAQLRKRRRR